MYKKFSRLAALALATIILSSTTVYAETTRRFNYTYGGITFIENTVSAFELARVIDRSYLPVPFERADDINVGGGRIFIADSLAGRVNVLCAYDYSFITSLRLMRDPDGRISTDPATGEQVMLDSPEGVFFNESLNLLFIADTAAERIVVLNGDDYTLVTEITRPYNMVGNTAFRPNRLVVDDAGRIFFLVHGSSEGIVVLEPDGDFARYFGTNRPSMSPIEFFWRSMATAEQREQMARSFAPPFSGIDIDPSGFIYATTADNSVQQMIFRFNARGDNVIRDTGFVGLRGDVVIFFSDLAYQSEFQAVSVTDFGVYAVVDSVRGRVWVYDFDGHIISIFGQLSDTLGGLREPSSLAWNGFDLLLADRAMGVINVYTPNRFGHAALMANYHAYHGNWDEATQYYRAAVSLNATFYAAYSGIGRNYLMQRRYREAMYYFDLAFDQEGYSRAWQGRRGELIADWFPLIAIIIVSLSVLLIYSEARYLRKAAYQEGRTNKKVKSKKECKTKQSEEAVNV
ncbi:MAG: hypothetical protein FWC92_03515 [Defluviitaleaceae bacterium]|nr:hypothetical protein [Defluviitaleaceae bacterium]